MRCGNDLKSALSPSKKEQMTVIPYFRQISADKMIEFTPSKNGGRGDVLPLF
jgi:hypothetical protein